MVKGTQGSVLTNLLMFDIGLIRSIDSEEVIIGEGNLWIGQRTT